jgi:hypothetical protein
VDGAETFGWAEPGRPAQAPTRGRPNADGQLEVDLPALHDWAMVVVRT